MSAAVVRTAARTALPEALLDLAAAQEALAKVTAERDRAMERWRASVELGIAAEAENAALRDALEQIIDRSNNGERGTSKVDDMRILALAAIAKEPKP